MLTSITPAFWGVGPFAALPLNGTTNQPLVQAKDALPAMRTGRSSTGQATAKLSSTFSGRVGPQQAGSFLTLAASEKPWR